MRRGFNTFLSSFALVFGASVSQSAMIYTGGDAGANSTDPRPNSVASATIFDADAGALGALKRIDFESQPVGAFSSLTLAPGVVVTGLDVYTKDQTIRNSPSDAPDSLYGYNTTLSGSRFAFFTGGWMTFTFANPIQAFGMYLTGMQSNAALHHVTFSDGSLLDISLPGLDGGGAYFIGITDAGKSIYSITVDMPNDYVGLDDIRYVETSVGAVPEPFTMGLAALGLGVALKRRRR